MLSGFGIAGLHRCGKSCRLRWINYLRPDLKRGSFTSEEKQTIIDVHRIFGNKYGYIFLEIVLIWFNEFFIIFIRVVFITRYNSHSFARMLQNNRTHDFKLQVLFFWAWVQNCLNQFVYNNIFPFDNKVIWINWTSK